jgi:hypothetical protein
MFLVEQADLTEEISGIQIGKYDFPAFVIFYQYGDRTINDVIEVVRRVPSLIISCFGV